MNIKKLIRKTAELIFQSKWYPNKKIVLESIPDLSCQSYPVFEYMLKIGLNNEYRLIWLVDDKNKYKNVCIKNVSFQNFIPQNVFQKLKRFYTMCTARAFLYDHRHIGKIFDKQLLVFLRHGTFIKSRLKHAKDNEFNESDLFVNTGKFFDKIDSEQLRIPAENVINTGFPNDDYLFETTDYAKIMFPDDEYRKIILWMPTFRQNKAKNADNNQRVDSNFDFPLGLPCLYTQEDCIEINNLLKDNKMLLVLKPHPAQDMSFIKEFNLENFRIIKDSDIEEKGIQLYQFLGSTDAMITDYSSVYYDYLLTGKSIGLTIDDYDEYAEKTGFAVNYFEMIIGHYVKNKDDMKEYLMTVSNGIDEYVEARERIKNIVYDYPDNRSTERVYNEIMKAIDKRYS